MCRTFLSLAEQQGQGALDFLHPLGLCAWRGGLVTLPVRGC